MPAVYDNGTPYATRGELGPYREADYLRLPAEPRCELLYGWLPVTPSPVVRHQRIVLALARHLFELAERRGGEAIISPMDVRLADHSIVQPDVIYVSRERAGIVRERIAGAPDLVIEILSPSTAERDLGEKMRLYGESGVAEYWIVDPELRTFEFLENQPDGFRVRLPEAGTYRSAAIAGLQIDLEAFWRRIPS
jgi:Uma2 family endonuclease